MPIKTNTYTTYEIKGQREDLSDLISNIAPTETPLLTMAGKGKKCSNTLFEWQQDSLAAVDLGNAQVEGNDFDSAGLQPCTPTVRLGNYVQISAKTAIVSGTANVTEKAGRGNDEMSYNMAKRAKELKRDQESIMLSNQGAAAGSSAAARKTGSLLAFVKTNVDKEATGIDPVYTTIPTGVRTDSAAPRAFTETMLKTVIQKVYISGGEVDTIMLGPAQKQVFSTFAGIAAQRYNAEGAKPSTVVGAVDIYVSDFGNLSAVPNRFQRNRDAWLLDRDMIDVRKLRDYKTEPLAKTGDAEKKMLVVEWGLQVENEAGIGLVADLT